ncbi:MAG TPA: hypothetical protein VIX90_15560, partial [Edaphobacter sp.]
LLRGDIDANDEESFTPARGDIDVSYMGRIGQGSVSKESVSAIGKSASAHAKTVAARISEVVNTDIPELVIKIALRHPRSRMRMWTRQNVGQADESAILDA